MPLCPLAHLHMEPVSSQLERRDSRVRSHCVWGHTGCGDVWRLETHGNFVRNLQVALGDAQWKRGRAPTVGNGVTARCVVGSEHLCARCGTESNWGAPYVPLVSVPLTNVQLSAK